MGDYTPVYTLGENVTSTASAAITGGVPLVVTGNGTVGPYTPAATPAQNVVGFATEDAVSGARVSFWARGPVHESLADGNITAGDQVGTAATAGRHVKTIAPSAVDVTASPTQSTINNGINGSVNAARGVLGVALTSATDNTKVRWMLFG